MLAQAGAARIENDRLARAARAQDAADARMADDHARLSDETIEGHRVEMFVSIQMRTRVGVAAGLCDDTKTAPPGDGIQRADKAWEGQLGADRREDHSTDPA